ncbi:PAS domain-containing sensor histidine kinase [Pseudanabaena cinerea]|nr:ATP-binding protein [Pseudanabaena cinerea]
MVFKWQSQRSCLYDLPLQWLMFIPFGLQIIGAVGLVSCFSNYYWTLCISGIMLIVSMAFAVLGTYWIRQALKKIKVSLKKSEQKYKVLFESLPIGISVTDPEGNLIEGNPASEAILTVPNQELTERTYDSPEWQIIRFDGSPMPTSEYASVRALTENRVIDNIKMGLLDADGNVRWLSVSADPIPLKGYGVAIASQAGQIVVEITNSGEAIPEEIMPRLFEPFFTTKPRGEGSGLGLDIVRQIVQKHGGDIQVSSQIGETTFSVSLPLIVIDSK